MKTQKSVDVSENIDVAADVVNTESETDPTKCMLRISFFKENDHNKDDFLFLSTAGRFRFSAELRLRRSSGVRRNPT